MLKVLIAIFCAALPLVAAEHWAVIVAGSRGYDNYRHHADACHAYHVVRRHGIPAENVVLMMYDDVANSTENPFPGKLFNRPINDTTLDRAEDVYAGCAIDYRGDNVTSDMFLNVLRGDANKTHGLKVLESTAEDRVFIFFVDHGARGILLFPTGDDMLTRKRLMETLHFMYKAKMYNELVVYIEACHSGSLFSSHEMSQINAFVTTAANGWEESWATYCSPNDVVNGVQMNTCLGDLYSVSWMEDSDLTDLSNETIKRQFDIVKAETNLSHVKKYGRNQISAEVVGNFMSNYDLHPEGSDESDDSDDDEPESNRATRVPSPQHGEVVAHDVPLTLAFYKYLRSSPGKQRTEYAEQLIQQMHLREQSDRLFAAIEMEYERQYNGKLQDTTTEPPSECVEQAYAAFRKHCAVEEDPDVGYGFSSYSLHYAGVLNNLCGALHDTKSIADLLATACRHHPRSAAINMRNFRLP